MDNQHTMDHEVNEDMDHEELRQMIREEIAEVLVQIAARLRGEEMGNEIKFDDYAQEVFETFVGEWESRITKEAMSMGRPLTHEEYLNYCNKHGIKNERDDGQTKI